MRRHVVGRHTDYLPDATALTGRRDQQYTSETTRARRRTWRNALVAYLLIRLWCFAAFDVPGQTAHVRGFTIREHQNSQENYPKIRELYSSHLIARLLENLSSALSRAFTAGQNIPKNRCRTTIAERMVKTRAELPFIGDQVGLSRAQPGRPKRTCNPLRPSPPPVAAPRLSIVILPFTNLSDDREQQYFTDGVTEDLTTDLSRLEN